MAGDVVADRYELNEVVGSGGMSSVYRAHDRVLERTVALKVLHERLVAQKDIVDRFSREAKLVAGLSHHNIVAVIDRGEYAGSPFIVLEYIPGENLKQLLGRQGPLPVERALELTIEIANGLAFAHQKGFVHRDVKPQNVLLNGKGEAKVTDFGIARPLEAKEGETQTGTVLGTCDYISPEQAQGRHVDEHTDIYSLGIVLYELLTGAVPFTGENFVAVAMQHINAPPPPVTLERPEVPRRVEEAVERALAKDPGDRFTTMSAFCDELEACLAEVRAGENTGATGVLPVVPPQRTVPPPARRRRRRGFVVIAVVALVVVAAAVIAALVATRDDGSADGSGGGTASPLVLTAVNSWDPYGDHHENTPRIGYATDGDPATYWSTETYYNPATGPFAAKPGVGIILAAPGVVKGRTLTITSSTPGYTAVIQSGPSSTGPFTDDSSSQPGAATTTFHLDGTASRYYLVWLTDRGDNSSVHINGVTATQST
ncbi:MAG TPA: protein kinase [Gaiellaceae bacterium]|jgi:serine/threonine-protein kinase|nr:protein kinase [Gaiellaceae bacterium]